jgi:uncharacterized damage-inducible protein DinB
LECQWFDVVGRLFTGWIASTTQRTPHGGPCLHEPWQLAEAASAVDVLRGELAMAGIDPVAYIATHGRTHKGQTLLLNVIRELGGRLKYKDADNPETVIIRAARMVLNREVTMAEATQEVTKSKKAKGGKAGKAKAVEQEVTKRASKEPETERRSQGQGIGETLVPLLKKAKADDARKLAQKLADGDQLSAKQLGTLRDAVNEAAGAMREAEDEKTAAAAQRWASLNPERRLPCLPPSPEETSCTPVHPTPSRRCARGCRR